MTTGVYSHFDRFDRGEGTGSSTGEFDNLDASSIFSNEWGSAAATTFNPADTDGYDEEIPYSKKQKFKTLYKLHNGKMEQTRKKDIVQSHIRNDLELFMSALELPEPQRERVREVLQSLDISSNNFGGRKYEKILLTLCSLISDEALSNTYSRTNPPDISEERLLNEEQFVELMDSVGMTITEHRKIRQQIRQRSDYF